MFGVSKNISHFQICSAIQKKFMFSKGSSGFFNTNATVVLQGNREVHETPGLCSTKTGRYCLFFLMTTWRYWEKTTESLQEVSTLRVGRSRRPPIPNCLAFCRSQRRIGLPSFSPEKTLLHF